jgi:hypothetical protein
MRRRCGYVAECVSVAIIETTGRWSLCDIFPWAEEDEGKEKKTDKQLEEKGCSDNESGVWCRC